MVFEAEKERLGNKEVMPTEKNINLFIGEESVDRLSCFEKLLGEHYDLNRELKFPFGEEYGWAYRYSHKKALLLYVFFEKCGFCCTVSINDKGAGIVGEMVSSMLPKTQRLWESRYPCGKEGGWIRYSVSNEEELKDIIRLVSCKVKQKK